MVHSGPFWPEEVHFGPFRSANSTLAIPDPKDVNSENSSYCRSFVWEFLSSFSPPEPPGAEIPISCQLLRASLKAPALIHTKPS